MARLRSRTEEGQALPLACLVMVATAAACVVVVRAGEVVIDRAEAVTAADAAALAGALGSEADARRVATANGAVLVSWRAAGPEVEVVVEKRNARARARARRGP